MRFFIAALLVVAAVSQSAVASAATSGPSKQTDISQIDSDAHAVATDQAQMDAAASKADHLTQEASTKLRNCAAANTDDESVCQPDASIVANDGHALEALTPILSAMTAVYNQAKTLASKANLRDGISTLNGWVKQAGQFLKTGSRIRRRGINAVMAVRA